jgi:hypothetical protein
VLIFLLVLGAFFALAVLPLMYTARALGAERTGFWWIVLVLILQAVVSRAGKELFGDDQVVTAVFVFLAGALAIKAILVTTYARAMLISVVSTVLTIIGGLLLVGLMFKLFN